MSARLEQLQKITENATEKAKEFKRLEKERKIKEEIDKQIKQAEQFDNKVREKTAYIEMMIFEAASKSHTEYEYNFGKDPDHELVKAVCQKFDDLRQVKSFKKGCICINYESDNWMDYDAEIVTFYWS